LSVKRKKKAQQQLQQQEQKEPETGTGSSEYLTDHKFDRTIKTLQANILQHNQSKKLEIIAAARLLEKQGYPLTKICDRITKALQGPKYETSGSYVRKVLPAQYKDPEQMATAFQQKHAGDTRYRQQEQVSKKPKEEITFEDIKRLNLTKAREVAKYQMGQAEWWEQQAKQIEEDLLKAFKSIRDNPQLSDAEIGKITREFVNKWFEQEERHKAEMKRLEEERQKAIEKVKPKPKPKLGKMGKEKEKMEVLQKMMVYRDSRIQFI
jgi:hypothetical protein